MFLGWWWLPFGHPGFNIHILYLVPNSQNKYPQNPYKKFCKPKYTNAMKFLNFFPKLILPFFLLCHQSWGIITENVHTSKEGNIGLSGIKWASCQATNFIAIILQGTQLQKKNTHVLATTLQAHRPTWCLGEEFWGARQLYIHQHSARWFLEDLIWSSIIFGINQEFCKELHFPQQWGAGSK